MNLSGFFRESLPDDLDTKEPSFLVTVWEKVELKAFKVESFDCNSSFVSELQTAFGFGYNRARKIHRQMQAQQIIDDKGFLIQ